MIRVCTQCGVEVGEPHVRIKAFNWKKRKPNIVRTNQNVSQNMIQDLLAKLGMRN